MSEASQRVQTALRERYERACRLDLDAQTRECIEYLEHPEILVAEFSDSFLTADVFDGRQEAFARVEELPVLRRRRSDLAVRRLMEVGAVSVSERDYRFRYVAREIVPLWTQQDTLDPLERRSVGLDYVGITEEEEPVPVLGVVNPPNSPAPYLALLRLLTCLAEVATDAQIERANRFLFKGELVERPAFDLHVLLMLPEANDKLPQPQAPLVMLTRDLAHVFVQRLREEWQLPDLLRHVLCLTMDRARFTGDLSCAWRV
jgi:hypothetical protein